MPTISYPTTVEIPGPWILDKDTLFELDSVMDDAQSLMRRDRDRMVDVALAQKISDLISRGEKQEWVEERRQSWREDILQDLSSRDYKTVTVYLSRGRTISGSSFSEIDALPSAIQENALGFRASLGAKNLTASAAMGEGCSGVALSISASPNDDEIAQEVFGRLQAWAIQNRPPRWQQTWFKVINFAGSMFIFFWIVLWISIWGAAANGFPKEDLKSEARQLLRSGVTSANSNRAIELLLSIESDYVPMANSGSYHTGRRAKGIFWLGLGILLSLRFCPKLVIGLWEGMASVSRWRWWVRMVSITIPASIITVLLIPWIMRWSQLGP